MAHKRAQIKARVQTVLTGLATTANNVFLSRIYPIATSDLPGLLIYANSESIERLEIGIQNRQQRTLDLSIEAIAKGNTAESTLDTITVEVEEAMANDQKLNGLAIDSAITDTQIRQASAESEFFIATMRYTVLYRTIDNDVE
jgi:hypothetical protein